MFRRVLQSQAPSKVIIKAAPRVTNTQRLRIGITAAANPWLTAKPLPPLFAAFTAGGQVSRTIRATAASIFRMCPTSGWEITNYFHQERKYGSQSSAATENEPSNSSMRSRLKKFNLKEVQVKGDGSCQFRAIAGAVFGDEERHKMVREKVASWLQANASAAVDNDGTKVSDFLDVSHFNNWNQYMTYVLRDGGTRELLELARNSALTTFLSIAWGDQLSLFAAAHVFNLHITIVSSVEAKGTDFISIIQPLNPTTPLTNITLSLWHEQHYNYCIADKPS